MTAAWAQTTGAGGAESSTALIGLVIIIGLIAGAVMLSRYAGRLRPWVRSSPYTATMLLMFLLWFIGDGGLTGIPNAGFIALFAALLAVRIVVELAAPAPSPRRRPHRSSTGQSDGGSGSYSHGNGWHFGDGGDGGGNGGGGGDGGGGGGGGD